MSKNKNDANRCRARINAQNLKWAREALSLSTEEVASKINIKDVTAEILTIWENGTEFPPVYIAKKLAKFYGINLVVLYLPRIPQNIKPLKDFRRMDSLPFSRNFIFLMRAIQEKQELLKELLIENENTDLPIVGSVSVRQGVPGLVQALKDNISKHLKLKKKAEDNLKPITRLLENFGISVSFSNSFNGHYLSAVSPKEVRGFAIADKVAPFIFVNSKDSKNAQLFTLLHEFCHILLGETGVGEQSHNADNRIEILCNQATAAFLIPSQEFEQVLRVLSSKDLDDTVYKLTRIFPVSSLSILIKMFSAGKLTYQDFEIAYIRYKESFEHILQQESRQKKSSRVIVKTDLRLFRQNGKRFTYIVLDGLQKGKIGFTEACSALGVSNGNKFDTYVNKWSKYT